MSSTPQQVRIAVIPPQRFWGKAQVRPPGWHPLLAHAADVAAVMQVLIQPSAALGRRLATLAGTAAAPPAWVFLAALHDLGKVNHGFQAKIRHGEADHHYPARGHVRPLLESIDPVPPLRELAFGLLPRLHPDPYQASLLLGSGLAHHGRPWTLERAEPGRDGLWRAHPNGRDPLAEAARLVAHAARWAALDPDSPGLTGALDSRATHLLAGTIMLADWVGSTGAAFPFAPWADDDPDRYWRERAQPQAAEACARIGLVPQTRPVSLAGLPLLEALFPATFGAAGGRPTPLQETLAALPLPAPGSRLLIESETGSGKTEAALALYARLRAAGLVAGLFFALPTRATAGAMFRRVQAALPGLYPGALPTVALAVGGDQPRAESSEPLLGEPPQRDDDPEEQDLAQWASSHAKAYLAAEIVVGTVDQALLASLPAKHAHLRLACLSRHLIVVDEVHAYDRYMTGLLAHLLDFHTAAGGLALFMSATLAAAERVRLGGGPAPDRSTAEALPYPTLAVSQGQGWRDLGVASVAVPKTVAWACCTLPAALAEAAAAVAAGARVLLLRNTVRAARQAVLALQEQGHEALLWRPQAACPTCPPYHSRYVLPDRLVLDEAVQARFGKPAAAQPGGCLLVSTQVAEQSLDVDFDLLLTDLCPIDVLLQRVGRLHRHPARRGHRPPDYAAVARVLVLAPPEGFGPHLGARHVEVGWGQDQPYPDYQDGELTRLLVAQCPTVVVPRDNRRLIEAVYHPTAREVLAADPAWAKYAQRADLADAHQRFVAQHFKLRFDLAYPCCHVQFNNELGLEYRTRLGADTVRIELPEPVRCWYTTPAQPVTTADLPGWAVPRRDGELLTTATARPARDGATCFALGSRVFWYAPDGWQWEED